MYYIKNIYLLVMICLASFTYSINSIDSINYLYDNNIKEFERKIGNRQALNYSLILADYLEKSKSIDINTVRYLINEKSADLSYLVVKESDSSELFTDNKLLPHNALIRLIQDNRIDIIELLINRADDLNIEREFFFGSYKNIHLGSNGLLGAILSENFLASINDIKLVWTYAKPFYRKGIFYAYHYEVSIALTDDVDNLQYFLNRNADISIIWKSVVDFNAIKCAKFLVKHGYGRSIVYENKRMTILEYVKLVGSKKMAHIVAKI